MPARQRWGKVAAGKLEIPFIELTDRIEQTSGMSLPDIFNLYGQEGYRRLEQRELGAVIESSKSCILAAAGGVSEEGRTFDLLLENFYTIWLTAAPEDHMNRVHCPGRFTADGWSSRSAY